MHLDNFPKVRIKFYDYRGGYAVEIQKKTWYGKKYWTHIIAYSGMQDKPFYYKSYDSALEMATKFFKWDLIINSNK